MAIHLRSTCIKWLNRFPSDGGISEILSPAMILDGVNGPYLSVKRVTFGTYALVQIKTTNNMNAQRTPCIALSESNQTDGNFFMSLHTGKRIHGNTWD